MNRIETISDLQSTRDYLTRRIVELETELVGKKRQLARVEKWLQNLNVIP